MKRVTTILLATTLFLAPYAFCSAEDGAEILLKAAKSAHGTEKVVSIKATYDSTVTNSVGKVEKSRRKVLVENPGVSDLRYLNAPLDGFPPGDEVLMLREYVKDQDPVIRNECVYYSTRSEEYVIRDGLMGARNFLNYGRFGDWFGVIVYNVDFKRGGDLVEAKQALEREYAFETTESETEIDGEKSFEIAVKSDGVEVGRFCITPGFGYACSKKQNRLWTDSNALPESVKGELCSEFVADRFIYDSKSEVHYPLHVIETAYSVGGRHSTTYEATFDEDSLQINKRIKPAEFALTIPQGAKVHDMRGGKSIVKVAKEECEIKLEGDSIDLTKIDALVDLPQE
ncbi:MAG: hypothetical protein IJU03_08060 [Thermoguttaceae bacterium]|nr:hypothetical protein [Thermoguttaceae bacterium]